MIKTIFYTAFALAAFAFKSILCRMALRGDEADALGFTVVRLASGAAVLIAISYMLKSAGRAGPKGDLLSAFFLFAYAICFSLAYLGLNAGTGALILFGCVQLTMVGVAMIRGEHPGKLEWVGLSAALGGLVYLVLPGLTAPPPKSAALMGAAGIAWGAYTIRGRGSSDPLSETTGNFLWSVPMVVLASAPYFSEVHLSARGTILAILSGGAASGVGYTAWYAALRHLSSARAAALQLAVPVIAALGGIVFLSETGTMRLLIASSLILGGIGLTIAGRGKK